MRLRRAHGTRIDHLAIDFVIAAQEHILDIAMAVGQAGDHPFQFFRKFAVLQVKNAIGEALRPRRVRASGAWRIVSRDERPDDHSRGICAQLHRQMRHYEIHRPLAP
ncbi:hypothetical protein [Sphingobium sp. D43FB]|uniref:hypothetical protein n=1 Tax=Sphingobium sp. D43FB TaxID=2017595 RepID=UPI0031B9B1DB